MAKCLLRGPWVVHTENGLGLSETVPKRITADWRAVCGKTACTVRRAGWRKPSRPLSAIYRDNTRSGRKKACGAVEQKKGLGTGRKKRRKSGWGALDMPGAHISRHGRC